MATTRIIQIYERTRKAIHAGYRKLFPLSMLTIFFIGKDEYQRRTARYDGFCRRVLARQKKAIEVAGSAVT